jgi:D-psicose/D-tagatose/L-ribulose 3-epimerase
VKLGANSLIWTARFDEEHLPLLDEIKAHGFDGIEIARFDFDGFPAAKIRQAASDVGLEIVFLSAFTGDLTLASDDAGVRQKSADHLRAACDATVALGADTLVGPFTTAVGYLPGRRRTKDEWARVVEGLQSVAGHFESAGVRMAVEPLNRFETYFLNTTADAIALCEAVGSPNVGVLFDTFHANIEEKSIPAALASLGKHLVHVHTCENDRGTPGSGHVDWEGVASQLQGQNYPGWCVIESFGFNIKEISAAACIWRDLAPSPAHIAWEGAEFLRNLLR